MWLKIEDSDRIYYINLLKCTDIYVSDDQVSFHDGDTRLGVIDEFPCENTKQNLLNQIDKFLTDNLPFTELNLHSDI